MHAQETLDLSGQAGRNKKKKEETEEDELRNEIIMTHIGMEKFSRACMLTSPKCPMFDIQRASVRPSVLEPADEAAPFMLRLYDFEYRFPDFLEALVRIAHFKNFGLPALCDRVNRLMHTIVLPLAGGEDQAQISPGMATALEKPYPCLQKHKEGLWKWYHARCDPHKPVGARTVTLAGFIDALSKTEQLTVDIPAVVEAWRQSLTFTLAPGEIDETDTSMEVTLSQLTQIFLRCAIAKSNIKVDEVVWGGAGNSSGEVSVERAADPFFRNFVRKHAV